MVAKSKTRSSKKKAIKQKQRQSVKIKFVSKSPHGGGASTSSSSSAGGGGAGPTVILQPQQTLPPPSTALPPAAPLGPSPRDVENLRQMIQRLERGSAQQQKDFQDRITQIATSLSGDLNTATQGVRDQLLQHINKVSSDTGAHLGDIRQSILDANARAEALRQDTSKFAERVQQDIGGVAQNVQGVAAQTESLRQETGQFAAQAATEIGRTNQRVVGLQQETGIIGNAVLNADAQRMADSQVLAGELVRTQQAINQGVGVANDLYRRVEQAQNGVVALQGETGALGEALMNIDDRVADNAQLSGEQLIDLIQGVHDGRYRLEGLDARVRRAYHEGVRVANGLQTQIDGIRTPHGPGEGVAGGLAAMSGGHTQRHAGGGYGGEMPALVGPSNQIEAAAGGGYPLLGPTPMTPAGPALPGPSNQIQNGGVGDNTMDLDL